jgi:hypothetical protein
LKHFPFSLSKTQFIGEDFSGFPLFYQGFRQSCAFYTGTGLPDHADIRKRAENFAVHRAAQSFFMRSPGWRSAEAQRLSTFAHGFIDNTGNEMVEHVNNCSSRRESAHFISGYFHARTDRWLT